MVVRIVKVLTHMVEPTEDGRLLKRVIRSALKVSTRNLNAAKATDGLIVDGRVVFANHIVKAGQRIEVHIPEQVDRVVEPIDTNLRVAYQDEDLLIIDKPAGLPSQISTRQEGLTVANGVAYICRKQQSFAYRPVNRLDKGTSGLMAVAKHAHAQDLLQRSLHSGSFVREYLALVVGELPQVNGTVDALIAKAKGATIRREVRPDGKPGKTNYKVLQKENGVSLVCLRLETGRTHQIRVHMAHLGCPVLGDFLYGAEDERLPQRFALHSCCLKLLQPLSGEQIDCQSAMPEGWADILGHKKMN